MNRSHSPATGGFIVEIEAWDPPDTDTLRARVTFEVDLSHSQFLQLEDARDHMKRVALTVIPESVGEMTK